MPTGYTSEIYEGKDVSLSEFAANCARAFGAFIHQRDDSSRDSLTYPPSPETDSYYVEALTKAKEELSRWEALDEEGRYAEWSQHYNDSLVKMHEVLAEKSELRSRYQRMLAQVQAVEVPSDLQNFKNFMVEQLETSIEFDCGNDEHTYEWFRPSEYSAWCDDRTQSTRRDVDYYHNELRRERERYAERVRYINLMKDTFGFEVEAAR